MSCQCSKPPEVFQVRLSHDSVASLSVELTYGSRESQVVTRSQAYAQTYGAGDSSSSYTLFETLVSFYVESVYIDSTPVAARSLYNHDDIAGSFRSVLGPLLEQMTVASRKTPYLEFERRTDSFPSHYQTFGRVSAGSEEGGQHSGKPRPLKLAAPTRLATVHQRALSGDDSGHRPTEFGAVLRAGDPLLPNDPE